MAMTPPTPDTCSSTRIPTSLSGAYTTPTAVLTNEACLFAPNKADTDDTAMGVAEIDSWTLFIDYDADIQLMDEITNDDTGEIFIVVAPPQKFKRPTDWSKDHIQVRIVHKPIQTPVA